MEASAATPRTARFGPFEADLLSGLLTRNGARVRLGLQPFQVLALLLRRPGEVVTREELRRELWPNGTYVDFEGSLNSALKKLRAALDDDPKDSQYIETLPKRGYRLIVPVNCSCPSIAQEGNVPGVANLPSRDSPTGSTRRLLGRRGLWLEWRLVGLVFFVLFLILIFSLSAFRRSGLRSTPSQAFADPVGRRPSLAVLGFRNNSGKVQDAWLASALADMLNTELSGGEGLRLAPGEDVANLRRSSPWPETDSLDPKTTERIGNALDSDFLVMGSFTVIPKSPRATLRVDARLQEARTGKIVAEVAGSGDESNLFEIVSQLGDRLRARLDIPALKQSEQLGLMVSMPLDPETARFYALGLEKLRAYDALAAKDLLEQAVEADPKFSLAHGMLARAWAELGYEQKRRDEAKKAYDLSADLPRAQRLLVQGDYFDSLGDHEKAASVYHALFELYPDDVEYGLQLAAAQKAAGHGNEAIGTLQRLRQLPPPASQDPRIDLAEQWASPMSKADELVLIRRAMNKALSQGKRLIYAQARKRECMSLNYGDHPELAATSCEEAYKIFLAAGNRLEAADCIRLIGDNQGYLGNEEAVATYQRALDILKHLGDHEKTGAVLNNLAIHFENEGQLQRAEQLYEQARIHFTQAGDKANVATAIGNIGDILFERGDLEGAARQYEEALQIEATLDAGSPGYLLYRLADLELTEGRVQEALRHAQAAVKEFPPERGGYQYLTGAMLELGDVLEAQGDLVGARQQYEQSLAIRKKIGSAGLLAENQEELAELALEEGHAGEAESLLRNAIAEFEKEKSDPASASAYTSLARALLAEGKPEDAREAIRNAFRLSGKSADPALNLAATIQDARIRAAETPSGTTRGRDFSNPRRELEHTISTAKRLGYYRIEADARLAVGELDMQVDPASGRSQLRALSQDAQDRGLVLVSMKAAELQKSPSSVARVASDRLRAR